MLVLPTTELTDCIEYPPYTPFITIEIRASYTRYGTNLEKASSGAFGLRSARGSINYSITHLNSRLDTDSTCTYLQPRVLTIRSLEYPTPSRARTSHSTAFHDVLTGQTVIRTNVQDLLIATWTSSPWSEITTHFDVPSPHLLYRPSQVTPAVHRIQATRAHKYTHSTPKPRPR